MKEPVKNILKLIFVGIATTVVRIIGQLSIPGRRAGGSGSQHFRTKRNHACCLYDLRDFRLLPDCRAVPAHTEKDGREPYPAGAAIQPCLLRSVDCLPVGASAPCGSLGSDHLSRSGRFGSPCHGAAAGLAVRTNKSSHKKHR